MEVRIGKAAGLGALADVLSVAEDVVVATGGHYGVAEIANVLVTVLTPAETELGIAQGRGKYILEEGFLMKVPTQGEGRENAPLVVGAEA